MNGLETLVKPEIEVKAENNIADSIPDFNDNQDTGSYLVTDMSISESIPDFNREDSEPVTAQDINESKDLAEEQRLEVEQESPYSDDVTESVKSVDELGVYKNSGLDEQLVNERPALVKTDIDLEQKDITNDTNLDRMEKGKPPIGKDNKPIELHHVGQGMDSPLAELESSEHKTNDRILHDKTVDSEIDRGQFQKERVQHWKARAEQLIAEG